MAQQQDDGPDDMLAAEYVLGTLDAAERAAFEQRLSSDPALRALLAGWERRLAPLSGAVAPLAPPPDLWQSIERALPPVALRPKLELIKGGGGPDRLRRDAVVWRRRAAGAGSLAALLAAALAVRESTRPPELGPAYVAVVNQGGEQPALIVRVDLASGSVAVRPVNARAPENKSYELWYIGDGVKPRSMGVVGTGPLKLALPVRADGEALGKAVFAITVEPPGGSPDGNPSGAPVLVGKLVRE